MPTVARGSVILSVSLHLCGNADVRHGLMAVTATSKERGSLTMLAATTMWGDRSEPVRIGHEGVTRGSPSAITI